MIWEPFALALIFGTAVSLTLYFVFIWPRREPEDPEAEETPDR